MVFYSYITNSVSGLSSSSSSSSSSSNNNNSDDNLGGGGGGNTIQQGNDSGGGISSSSTSTAAERRRTVAAWPLVVHFEPFELSVLITQFEDVERSPLATRYAQYNVRADAACRIQALFRGASTRWISSSSSSSSCKKQNAITTSSSSSSSVKDGRGDVGAEISINSTATVIEPTNSFNPRREFTYINGTIVRRKFTSRYHEGEITEYDPVEKYYKITYRDGDTAQMTYHEVTLYLKEFQQYSKSEKKDSFNNNNNNNNEKDNNNKDYNYNCDEDDDDVNSVFITQQMNHQQQHHHRDQNKNTSKADQYPTTMPRSTHTTESNITSVSAGKNKPRFTSQRSTRAYPDLPELTTFISTSEPGHTIRAPSKPLIRTNETKRKRSKKKVIFSMPKNEEFFFLQDEASNVRKVETRTETQTHQMSPSSSPLLSSNNNKDDDNTIQQGNDSGGGGISSSSSSSSSSKKQNAIIAASSSSTTSSSVEDGRGDVGAEKRANSNSSSSSSSSSNKRSSSYSINNNNNNEKENYDKASSSSVKNGRDNVGAEKRANSSSSSSNKGNSSYSLNNNNNNNNNEKDSGKRKRVLEDDGDELRPSKVSLPSSNPFDVDCAGGLLQAQALKRDLKQQLKEYDMSFAGRHGRMPVTAEKEPIRHLYKRYNALKIHIGDMEAQRPTAAERRRIVAACRDLRAQITRFEDAFVQLHGRPPKGAVERSPLAATYAQYRVGKRTIRADAACKIQALFRNVRRVETTTKTQTHQMSPQLSKKMHGGKSKRKGPPSPPADEVANAFGTTSVQASSHDTVALALSTIHSSFMKNGRSLHCIKWLSTIDSFSETLSPSPPTDEVEKASSTTCVQAYSHGVRCTHVEDDGDVENVSANNSYAYISTSTSTSWKRGGGYIDNNGGGGDRHSGPSFRVGGGDERDRYDTSFPENKDESGITKQQQQQELEPPIERNTTSNSYTNNYYRLHKIDGKIAARAPASTAVPAPAITGNEILDDCNDKDSDFFFFDNTHPFSSQWKVRWDSGW